MTLIADRVDIAARPSNPDPLAYSYYVNDQVRTISQDGVSKAYTLDPARRHYRTEASAAPRIPSVPTTPMARTPRCSATFNASSEFVSGQRYIEGIDGDLAGIRSVDIPADTDETVLHLSNLHGDTIATASLAPEATQLLDRFESDEFGSPRQAGGADKRLGWLGAKQRRTELASGVIQMGVRSYVPAMGRFTSVDPVEGGSANDYDYANQDPINTYDLDGRCPFCPLALAVGLRLAPVAARLLRGAKHSSRTVRKGGQRAKTAARRINKGGRVNNVIATALGPMGRQLYNYAKTRGGSRVFGYGTRANTGRFRIGLGQHRNHEWFSNILGS